MKQAINIAVSFAFWVSRLHSTMARIHPKCFRMKVKINIPMYKQYVYIHINSHVPFIRILGYSLLILWMYSLSNKFIYNTLNYIFIYEANPLITTHLFIYIIYAHLKE